MSFDQLYGLLKKKGLTPSRFVQRLQGWDEVTVIDFVEEASSITRKLHDSTATAYSFAANGPFSGDPHPCSATACRLRRIDQVGRFAALYSDKVFVVDPFEQVRSPVYFEASLRDDIVFAIALLFHLKSAFDAGLVSIGSRRIGFCDKCLVRLNSRAKKAETALVKRF